MNLRLLLCCTMCFDVIALVLLGFNCRLIKSG